MGQLVAEEVAAAGLTLAGGVGRGGDIAALAADSDVVIDFTVGTTVAGHAAVLRAAGVGPGGGGGGVGAGDNWVFRGGFGSGGRGGGDYPGGGGAEFFGRREFIAGAGGTAGRGAAGELL